MKRYPHLLPEVFKTKKGNSVLILCAHNVCHAKQPITDKSGEEGERGKSFNDFSLKYTKKKKKKKLTISHLGLYLKEEKKKWHNTHTKENQKMESLLGVLAPSQAPRDAAILVEFLVFI